MRQVISTALVAVIVGALAGATMSAVAQAPAEQALTPAAGINAASVDGKSAVGYTNKKAARRGKLVATNKAGELPPNIVRPFWGYLKNKPGILADDQIAWGELQGLPAGFADGIDDGITTMKVTQVTGAVTALAASGNGTATATCPTGSLPIAGGHTTSSYLVYNVSSFRSGNGWIVAAHNDDAAAAHNLNSYVYCLATTPSTGYTIAGRNAGGVTPATNNRPPFPKTRK